MTNARKNRGTGNRGAKNRESSFWDAIEAKKKEKEGKKNG